MNPGARFEAGIRREAAPGPLPTESDPVLLAQVVAEIELSGPMTFARFMAIALYDPEHGYYRTAAERPGRAGDFLTAADLDPIFGAALGRQVEETWQRLDRPAAFTLLEYGPGSGSLAVAILAGLRADGSELAGLIAYEPVEINAHRRADIVARLGPGVRLREGPAEAAGRGGPGPGPIDGIVVANEFLDALPVHRVEGRDGRLLERFVALEPATGRLIERAGEPSTPALAERLAADGVSLAEGLVAEVCLGVEPWLAEVSRRLARGLVLVIDYGHRAADLYDPARTGGSLRAYVGQRAHADPFVAIGRQDLTAHVDLTALEAAAGRQSFDVLGEVSQAELLLGCGLEELVDRIRSDPATTLETWLATRSAVARLLDPAALGGFRAVLLGRGLATEPPPRGLSHRLPGR